MRTRRTAGLNQLGPPPRASRPTFKYGRNKIKHPEAYAEAVQVREKLAKRTPLQKEFAQAKSWFKKKLPLPKLKFLEEPESD